jgi:hypothetical protein
MIRDADSNTKYPWKIGSTLEAVNWTEGGKWLLGETRPFDLVAEVYVSDTPQVNTTKTERDELVEKAALAILTGRHANPGPTFSYGNKGLWSAAEEFVEARKK